MTAGESHLQGQVVAFFICYLYTFNIHVVGGEQKCTSKPHPCANTPLKLFSQAAKHLSSATNAASRQQWELLCERDDLLNILAISHFKGNNQHFELSLGMKE